MAGNLRYFADRLGVPRAGIEGTTLPYDLVRANAAWGPPQVALSPRRKGQHLLVRRRRTYFGFELEVGVQEIRGPLPEGLGDNARRALVDGLMAGETVHPDQGRLRRALEELGELWRRSGGAVSAVSAEALKDRLREQLSQVDTWEGFLATRLSLDPRLLVPEVDREALMQLPSVIRLHGDAVALDYEVEDGVGVVRLRMKEGQAARLHPRDLPALDRPIRFTVVRGSHAAIRAASLPELKAMLRTLPRAGRKERRRRR